LDHFNVEKGDKFELLFRLDDETTYPLAGAVRVDRIGGCLKWSSSAARTTPPSNYFVDAPEQMFVGTAAPRPCKRPPIRT